MPAEPGTLFLTVRFPAEGALAHGFKVEPLGRNLYRVMEIPFLSDTVSYRDVIELTRGQDDTYECVAIRERAGWRRSDFLISKDLAESDRLTAILSRVIAAGGVWERVMGGCLSVVMPPDSAWDPTTEIESQR